MIFSTNDHFEKVFHRQFNCHDDDDEADAPNRRRSRSKTAFSAKWMMLVLVMMMTLMMTPKRLFVAAFSPSATNVATFAQSSRPTTTTTTRSVTFVPKLSSTRKKIVNFATTTTTTTPTTTTATDSAQSTATTTSSSSSSSDDDAPSTWTAVVRAPLRFLGGPAATYPCISLRFPHLATRSQRQRNVQGVSLDFVVDTAANINTIQNAVAYELGLAAVGQALPGVSAAGRMTGGVTYALGDAQLENAIIEGELADGEESATVTAGSESGGNVENDENHDDVLTNSSATTKPEPFTFMTGLTASAVPVANPVAAGVLGMAFLQCFAGGVEFNWHAELSTTMSTPNAANVTTAANNTASSLSVPLPSPSIAFYAERNDAATAGRVCVPIQRIPVTQLPMVMVTINGVELPALLDTGSPITVLNAAAAQRAGIVTVEAPQKDVERRNPWLAAFTGTKPSPAQVSSQQQPAQRRPNEVLTVMGSNGKPAQLLQSKEPHVVSLMGTRRPTTTTMTKENVNENDINVSTTASQVSFGNCHVYVGDLPGLAALKGWGGIDVPPAMVLGMDVLRHQPSMLLRAQDNQVWF